MKTCNAVWEAAPQSCPPLVFTSHFSPHNLFGLIKNLSKVNQMLSFEDPPTDALDLVGENSELQIKLIDFQLGNCPIGCHCPLMPEKSI